MKQANQLIEWNDQLKTDIYVIDEEHHFLIENINLLHQISLQPNQESVDVQGEIKAVFDNLAYYAQTHFVVEEELMRVWHYDHFFEHKQEHDQFLNRVVSLQKDMELEGIQLGEALLNFLKNWLTQHIMKVDQTMTAYLKSKGQN